MTRASREEIKLTVKKRKKWEGGVKKTLREKKDVPLFFGLGERGNS